MSDRTFVDTKILVYAQYLDAGEKHIVAKGIVTELWNSRAGVLSTQVLQEFYVTLTRKIPSPVKVPNARRIISNYLNWDVAVNDGRTILQASEIEEAYNLSFWDSMIIAAAYSKNAAILLTEDLNGGQKIEGVTVLNPFLDPAAAEYAAPRI